MKNNMNYRRALEVIHQETYEVKSVPNVSNNSELLILRSSDNTETNQPPKQTDTSTALVDNKQMGCALSNSVDNED